ncbi:MAG: hypothetical protein WBP83_02510 [Nitrososphaeraceae archaeon]
MNKSNMPPRRSLAWISRDGSNAGASLLRLSPLTSGILLVSLTLITTTSFAQEENDTTVSPFVLDY